MTTQSSQATYFEYKDSLFDLSDATELSHFNLTITPIDLVAHWQRCGKLADFISNFQSYNFQDKSKSRRILSTIINEMVENVVKFNTNNLKDIHIHIKNLAHFLTIETRNTSSSTQTQNYIHCLSQFKDHDIETLYINQLMASAESHDNQSGLGLLSLKKDFNADLSVLIEHKDENHFFVRSTVTLNMDAIDSSSS